MKINKLTLIFVICCFIPVLGVSGCGGNTKKTADSDKSEQNSEAIDSPNSDPAMPEDQFPVLDQEDSDSDNNNNANNGEYFEADTTSPEIVLYSPNGFDLGCDENLYVKFSENIDCAAISEKNVVNVINDLNEVIAGDITCVGDELRYEFADNLEQNITYTATISTDVRDIANNRLAEEFSWDFSTASIIYVDQNAITGEKNGCSWQNAFVDLQVAITKAADLDSGVDQIWVAKGIYTPAEPGGARTLSFNLLKNVEFYGGFPVGGSDFAERDWLLNETILSGDLNNDDIDFVNNSENSYHVVDATGVDATAILDGFVIQAGNADGSGPPDSDKGGGVYMYDCSALLSSLNLRENIAIHGGGIYTEASEVNLLNVSFEDNIATASGGGLNIVFPRSNPLLTDVVFYSNRARFGGGLNIRAGQAILTNLTFNNNEAVGIGARGGGLYNLNSNPTIINTIFWGNTAADAGKQIYNNDSVPIISFSLIEDSGGSGPDWDILLGTDIANNIDVDPMFMDVLNNDLRLSMHSPAIDIGNSAPQADINGDGLLDFISLPEFDIGGQVRLQDGDLVSGAIIDLGVHEYQSF